MRLNFPKNLIIFLKYLDFASIEIDFPDVEDEIINKADIKDGPLNF